MPGSCRILISPASLESWVFSSCHVCEFCHPCSMGQELGNWPAISQHYIYTIAAHMCMLIFLYFFCTSRVCCMRSYSVHWFSSGFFFYLVFSLRYHKEAWWYGLILAKALRLFLWRGHVTGAVFLQVFLLHPVSAFCLVLLCYSCFLSVCANIVTEKLVAGWGMGGPF